MEKHDEEACIRLHNNERDFQLQGIILPEESTPAGSYFQELLSALYKYKMMDEEALHKTQLKLAELLAGQTKRYTGGESSSVAIEKARDLLQAICYLIGVCLKAVPDRRQRIDLLCRQDLRALSHEGETMVSDRLKQYRKKLEKLQKESLKVNHIAYQDTIFRGIPDYFLGYDVEFAPQEDGGSIDYPLCREITGSSGIEFICPYLDRLEEENHFCSQFPAEQINGLLLGYHEEAEHLLFNIYELVLTNAVGNVLLGRNGLSITSSDRERLQKKLMIYGREELAERLAKAYRELCINLDYHEILPGYGEECVIGIAERLVHNLKLHRLEHMFLTLGGTGKTRQGASYISGEKMEDEKLRELIKELNECAGTADKLVRIKQEVRSLEDLAELLELCFDREEYPFVYRLLTDEEKRQLYRYRMQRK